jgi:glycosyltransferase involved in cell wall biosynthesis
MNEILLSVIIPVCNREALVIRSIESVLTQNEKSCEIIVIDDGSTDRTWESIARYKETPRTRIHRFEENKVVNAARNYGVSMSYGKYVLFLDSDDYLIKGSLADLNLKLSHYPDIGHFWFNRIDETTGLKYIVSPMDGAEISFTDKVNAKYEGDFVHVLRSSYIKEFPFFEEFRAEEYLNWYRISRKYSPEKYFDLDVVACKRNAPDSLTRKLRSHSKERMVEKYRALNMEIALFKDEYSRYNPTRLSRVTVKAVLLGIICGKYSDNGKMIINLKYLNAWKLGSLRLFNFLRLQWLLLALLRIKYFFDKFFRR